MFEIDKLNINIFDRIEDIDEQINYHTEYEIAIIADAEKAFIKLLETKYNEVNIRTILMVMMDFIVRDWIDIAFISVKTLHFILLKEILLEHQMFTITQT
ncbi:hypothetical protein D3C74_332770 [compost metagenome]